MNKDEKEILTEEENTSADNVAAEHSSEAAEQDPLAAAQEELDELKNKYLRLMAEFDNYKKRTAKERMEIIRTASKDLIGSLLPVLDDFDRAKKTGADDGTAETFPQGVELVYNKLYSILKQRGLEPMDVEDKSFNPELHEAITKIPAPTADMKGKIIDFIEKGYTLNDKIIRHAKVVIGE